MATTRSELYLPTSGELHRAGADLEALVPREQWAVYAPVLNEARRRGLRFAVGGGLAFSLYAGQRRNTKDLDVFILPDDHAAFLDLMAAERFSEYTAVPYDPTWSYRGHKQEYILDVLWRMLNDRAAIDEIWVNRGWQVEIYGDPLRLIPAEELIWSKIYILYRERCDWPDILSILHARGARLDWRHLLDRLGEDRTLLASVLHLFRWLCPGEAVALPVWLWEELRDPPSDWPAVDRQRAAFIHGEEWFPADLHRP